MAPRRIFITFIVRMNVVENIDLVRNRIAAACRKTNHNPDGIKLVAVTKTVGVEAIEEVLAGGVTMVGENRIQEAWQKFQLVESYAEWHMIGHLQRNKVKQCLRFAQTIQSVDSVRLAREIHVQAEKLARSIEVLIQVNTSGEASKFGFTPDDVGDALAEIAQLSRLKVKGLMTIGAFSPDEKVVRASFVRLRALRDSLQENLLPAVELKELSMGMTNDFEIAVEEGSTMIRIGRSIFGERT